MPFSLSLSQSLYMHIINCIVLAYYWSNMETNMASVMLIDIDFIEFHRRLQWWNWAHVGDVVKSTELLSPISH